MSELYQKVMDNDLLHDDTSIRSVAQVRTGCTGPRQSLPLALPCAINDFSIPRWVCFLYAAI